MGKAAGNRKPREIEQCDLAHRVWALSSGLFDTTAGHRFRPDSAALHGLIFTLLHAKYRDSGSLMDSILECTKCDQKMSRTE